MKGDGTATEHVSDATQLINAVPLGQTLGSTGDITTRLIAGLI
jgi:hypothetical protein